MHGGVFIGLLSGIAVDPEPAPALGTVTYPPILHIPGFTPGDIPPPSTPPPPGGSTDIDAAIERYFAPIDWECAKCIRRHESTGASSHNPGYIKPDGSRSEDSWGWWQINLLAHPYVTLDQTADVDWSTRYAAGLRYGRGNWGDWACSAIACGCESDTACPR